MNPLTFVALIVNGLLITGIVNMAYVGTHNLLSLGNTVTATAPEIVRSPNIEVTLIKTTSTALYAKPIPDPTGITYLPSRNTFYITDSEVDETPLFAGTQIFEVSLAGEFLGSWSSTTFGHDITEIQTDPDESHIYVTDDVARKIFVFTPGVDQQFGTDDDVYTSISTPSFGSLDPEGIDLDSNQGHLYLLDDTGVLYEISPGTNGIFDGIIPQGDDHVIPYDLSGTGMKFLKGITYNADTNHLYVTGRPATEIAELTMTGRLVQTFSISMTQPIEPSDLVFAPSSTNPADTHLYVTDRGQDNEVREDENDGRIFEMSIALIPPDHQAPIVDVGPDLSAFMANPTTQLSATVQIAPSISMSNVEMQWAQLTGPANVTFTNQNTASTQASFSAEGSYVLRLLVDDGQLTSSDTLVITVEAGDGKKRVHLPRIGK